MSLLYLILYHEVKLGQTWTLGICTLQETCEIRGILIKRQNSFYNFNLTITFPSFFSLTICAALFHISLFLFQETF